MNTIPDLYLVDHDSELIAAWETAFSSFCGVKVILGDYFSIEADLMVSPANSFGFMDGGLDFAIRENLGVEIEEKLQKEIIEKFKGELPVGSCLIIETNNEKWPWLASAPTMRVPMLISGTFNVYYAFRAILLAVANHPKRIGSILCPGLGTGIGGVAPKSAAGQMAFAYSQFTAKPSIPKASQVLAAHQELVKYVQV